MSFSKCPRAGGSAVVSMAAGNRRSTGNDSSKPMVEGSAKSLIFGEEDEKKVYVAPAPPRVDLTAGLPMPAIRSAVNQNRERRGPSDQDLEAARLQQAEGAKSFFEARSAMESVRKNQMRVRQISNGADSSYPEPGQHSITEEPGVSRSNADLIATGLRRKPGQAPEVLAMVAGGAGAANEAEDDLLQMERTLDAHGARADDDQTDHQHEMERTFNGSRKSVTLGGSEIFTLPDEAEMASPPQRNRYEGDGEDLEEDRDTAEANILKEKNTFRPREAVASPAKKQPTSNWWPHQEAKKGAAGPVVDAGGDKELQAILKAADEAHVVAKFNSAAAEAFRDAREAREQGRSRNHGGAERVFGKAGGGDELILSVSGARKRRPQLPPSQMANGGGLFGGLSDQPEKQPKQPNNLDLQAALEAVDNAAQSVKVISLEASAFHDARAARELQVQRNRAGTQKGGLFGRDAPTAPPPRLTGENVITWS